MDTFLNTLLSLRIKRGATAGHFDVDSKQRQGRGAVKSQMKSECGEFGLLDDAAFTRIIHRADRSRGNRYGSTLVVLLLWQDSWGMRYHN
jgi:hypothetical protein